MSEKEFLECCGGPNDHSVLWNAMIHPLLNLTIHGAIWYQGNISIICTQYICLKPGCVFYYNIVTDS